MSNKTAVSREMRFRENQNKRGYKQVRVWVPEGDIESIKKAALRYRNKFAKENSK